jgi:hypothetical protein
MAGYHHRVHGYVDFYCPLPGFIVLLFRILVLLKFISTIGSYHEAYGDGAWVQLVFTGTRVRVNATVPTTGYSTRVGIYLDNKLVSTYTNDVPAKPLPIETDYKPFITIFDQDGLLPAQHTLKVVTIGNDTLLLMDCVEFEQSEALFTITTDNSASTSAPAIGSGSAGAFMTSPSVTGAPTGSTITITRTTTGLNVTLPTASSNSTSVILSNGDSQAIQTMTATSGAIINSNPNVLSASPNPSSGTIAGAVIGSLAALALLILLGIFFFRRYQSKQHGILQDEPIEDGTGGMPREEALTGAAEGAAMRQIPSGMPLMHDQSSSPANEAAVVFDPFRGPITEHIPVPLVRVGNLNDSDRESTSYQTLPSYHEDILEAQSQLQASNPGEGGAAARQLSQADINAISQRLTEVMRTQIQQNGGNPSAFNSRIIVSPRELIDHLVAERLNPREVA